MSGPAFDEPATRRRRRKRARGGSRRGPAVLPQLFTTGNLAAGFYAIVKASAGELDAAALGVLVAMLFDMLDGRVARMARATSRFGMEYDSIADTVSFGVAPAIIAFSSGDLQELGWTGWVLAFLFTVCAALRLARFNVSPIRWEGRFEGLPSPAAAGMVASTTWFAGLMKESGMPLDPPAMLVGLGVATLGLLMVSPTPYRSFKGARLGGSYRSVVAAVVGLTVVFSKPSLTFFLIGILYVCSGPVEWLWRWRTGQELVPHVPADEDLDEESPGLGA